MVYAQPRIHPRKWDTQTPLEYIDTNGSSNLGQTTRPGDSLQKKEKKICRMVDFAVQAGNWVKLKEGENRDKCLDLAKELKNNYGT